MAPVNERVSSQQPVLLVAAGSAGHAEPQTSDQTRVSAEATVTHWRRAGDYQAVFTEFLERQHGDVSPVYVVRQKNFAVLISDIQYC